MNRKKLKWINHMLDVKNADISIITFYLIHNLVKKTVGTLTVIGFVSYPNVKPTEKPIEKYIIT
jgi:hypothetical protein